MTEVKTHFSNFPFLNFNRDFTDIQKKILEILYSNPKGLDRTELEQVTQIPRTTIYENIFRNSDKINKNECIIKIIEEKTGRIGRPRKVYYLN